MKSEKEIRTAIKNINQFGVVSVEDPYVSPPHEILAIEDMRSFLTALHWVLVDTNWCERKQCNGSKEAYSL